MKARLINFVLALLSAGWLVPLWLGIDTYLTFFRVEVWPLLGGQKPLNSFPFLEFTSRCMTLSLFWLGLVIIFWAYRLLFFFSQQKSLTWRSSGTPQKRGAP